MAVHAAQIAALKENDEADAGTVDGTECFDGMNIAFDAIEKITRNEDYKRSDYILIKGSIQEEDITIVNIYVPNIGAPQYIRQTLTDIKGELDRNTIIVGDFNTPHQWTDHQNRKLIRKHKS